MIETANKETRLRDIVHGMGSAVIAFSGGVDSATLLAIAASELGGRALAVTGRSPSVAEGEIENAIALARVVGARHEIVDTREFENPLYRENASNRCYYCKDELFGRLHDIARERNYAYVVDGTNADDGIDALDVRPGRQAAVRWEVRSPLAEAGLGKDAIRRLARRLGLPVWDKPATPCLASRVPHGTRVEIEDLRRIDLSERYLRAAGFEVVRVRHYGQVARIEVPARDVARLEAMQVRIARALSAVGYETVEIDSRGYRTGSLNDVTKA